MRTVAIIIDFDNYFGTDVSKLSSELLEYSFSEFVNICQKKFSEFDSVNIRLYGGWYKETSLTKQASALQQLLFNVNVFPKIQNKKIIQGSVDMVSSLYSIPGFTWGYTHKEKEGISKVRINHECVDTMCNENRSTCPKFILYKFTDKKDKTCAVAGCNNLQKDVFKGIEQKMVDTLIACDIISITDDEQTVGVFIISDDQDHFPSLALANQRQEYKQVKHLQGILLGIKNEQKLEFISSFLQPFKIQTISIS